MHFSKLLALIAATTNAFVLATTEADKCQSANDKCLLNNKPAIQCNCQLATCQGEDNARTREYCDKAMANDWKDLDASPPPPETDDCPAKFKKCTGEEKRPQIQCSCELATCSGEDSATEREYCDRAKKNGWEDPDAAPPPPPTPPAGGDDDDDDCHAKYKQCTGEDGKPEVQCGCELASCEGGDSARGREHCDTAEKNGWVESSV